MVEFGGQAAAVTSPECVHQPVLSEPSLTLCCARCGAWLKAVDEDEHEVVPRAEATRGTHVCPECGAEWVGNEEWCEECERPTWATT